MMDQDFNFILEPYGCHNIFPCLVLFVSLFSVWDHVSICEFISVILSSLTPMKLEFRLVDKHK